MKPTLRPGLNATLSYQVPEERTVPHFLPESDEFASMPHVLATGYPVGLVEWTCMQALAPHLEPGERTLDDGVVDRDDGDMCDHSVGGRSSHGCETTDCRRS